MTSDQQNPGVNYNLFIKDLLSIYDITDSDVHSLLHRNSTEELSRSIGKCFVEDLLRESFIFQ